MVSRFRQYWHDIESSFWFVPGLIVIAAILLAIGFINADAHIGEGVID